MKRAILFSLCFSLLFCGCEQQTVSSEMSSMTDQFSSSFPLSDYSYTIIHNSVEITAYTGNGEIVRIPSKINNLEVTAIAEGAFYQCSDMKEILFPATIQKIAADAFYRCSSLEAVHLPPEIDTIEGNPFFRCSSLKTITVDEANTYFSSIDGVLYTKDVSALIVYPEGKADISYIVPASVTKIEEDAFGYRPLLKYVTMYENVISLPESNMFIFPSEITLWVEVGSVAEAYAKKHNLLYENITN